MSERELTPELARQIFGPRDLNEQTPEPPIEGLPPKDKAITEYTLDEQEAQHQETLRVLRQQEREAEEERQREQAEANRTAAQRHGDTLSAALQPGAKHEANVRLVGLLHPTTEDDR